ncbi:hypothetical protein EVAR_43863_1 [Eumeta japonica]|uniref:Mos1 transposase HTH domain-containing protein n=1 Tax=Eumeta variegata TaxID=151549 RepID=A0A4C1X161_EUMVA|nr:hypothetical protein EVAR_43863_1 [Eumeta japonica]
MKNTAIQRHAVAARVARPLRSRTPALCNHAQSLARHQTALGDEAPCKTIIYNWFAEFKRGRVNLSDEFRSSSAVINKSIDAVRPMIETDWHVTYHTRREHPQA